MEYPSKLIEQAVTEISRLPGIGKKTALRLVLHLLKQPESISEALAQSIVQLKKETRYCLTCHMIGDSQECFCQSVTRDNSVVCVVEDVPDIIAIKNTAQYQGLFHVLGGVISPINGVGPGDLNIGSLIERLRNNGEIKEVILALSATMEGDTTSFYLAKKLNEFDVAVTTIARGVPVGSELEYTDEVTLGRSIITRMKYQVEND